MAIKVLHLCGGSANSGAGRGAAWLHDGLKSLGVDSRACFARDHLENVKTKSGVATQLKYLRERIYYTLDRKISSALRQPAQARTFFKSVFTHEIVSNVNTFSDADIIHVHWIGDGSFDLGKLASLGKPVVVTLRDMLMFTGGCYYDLGCGKFTGTCSPCPALRRYVPPSIAAGVQKRRRKDSAENVTFVAISHWLREQAERSFALGGLGTRMISNSINVDNFYPVDTAQVRAAIGARPDQSIILAGCIDLAATYKNMHMLVQVWNAVQRDDRMLVVFGNDTGGLQKEFPDTVRFIGSVSDNSYLRELYSAADVFLMPSIQEAFGKTVVEASLCGTPVVAYANTGAADIILHKETGYLAKFDDVEDFTLGVNFVLEQQRLNDDLAKLAQKHCVENFNHIAKASEYKNLYEELLNGAQ